MRSGLHSLLVKGLGFEGKTQLSPKPFNWMGNLEHLQLDIKEVLRTVLEGVLRRKEGICDVKAW